MSLADSAELAMIRAMLKSRVPVGQSTAHLDEHDGCGASVSALLSFSDALADELRSERERNEALENECRELRKPNTATTSSVTFDPHLYDWLCSFMLQWVTRPNDPTRDGGDVPRLSDVEELTAIFRHAAKPLHARITELEGGIVAENRRVTKKIDALVAAGDTLAEVTKLSTIPHASALNSWEKAKDG